MHSGLMHDGCLVTNSRSVATGSSNRTKSAVQRNDENLVVFRDIQPGAPVHLLIVPKKHIRSINDLVEQDQDVLWKMILKARDMARIQSIAESGYKLLFNVERGGGQHIFHLHLHVFGGW